MSTDFITAEVKKIMENTDYVFPLNMSMATTWIIGNLKGVNLKLINMEKESSLSEYYILASSTNPTQSKAIADTIIRQMKEYNYNPISTEGFGNCDWLLIDFGDIMIHIFQEGTRNIYNLDGLWDNAPKVDIPNEYYYSSELDKENEVSKGYF